MSLPIYIPYEIKSREFNGKLLLIAYLLNIGFDEIYFGSRPGTYREALYNQSGIYLFKSMTKKHIYRYKLLKEKGNLLAMLQIEGGVYFKHTTDFIGSFFNDDYLKYLELNFLFGQSMKDEINKYYNDRYSAISIVSGEPRFDLLKPEYHSFFKRESNKIRRKYGDFLLVNTNFVASNPYQGKKMFIDNIEKDISVKKSFKDFAFKKMDLYTNVLNSFIKAIKRLAKELGNKIIIVRPHPGESISIYLKEFDNFKNIIVTNEGDVTEWIIGSKGIIHYDCTTGIEGFLAQKPVISYLPMKYDDLIVQLPILVSKNVNNESKLVENVKDIFNDNFKFEISGKNLELFKYYFHNYGEDAALIMAKSIKNLTESINFNKKQSNQLKIAINRILDSKKQNLKKIINKMIFRKPSNSEYKFGNIELCEVKDKLLDLIELKGWNVRFSTKSVRPDVIKIKRI